MKNRCSRLLVGFLCVVLLPICSWAQASQNDPVLDEIARRTAARASKAHARRVLVLTIQGCLLDPTVCSSLDQEIRTELQEAIPDVQLLTRSDVLPLLSMHGLLPIDAYTSAVEPVGVDLGGDLMVAESLTGVDSGYDVSAILTDLRKRSKLDEFRTKLKWRDLDSKPSAEPLVFREPADGPALLIFGVPSSARKGRYPTCEYCPEPAYTQEARERKFQGIVLLAVTITEQGTAQQVAVVRGLGGGLAESAARAVRGWRFKPAAGPDGKALATRTPIEVNFVLTR